MKSRMRTQDPLAEILQSQQEEIQKYKWIESEKAGRDIGLEQATREWMTKYFPQWKQYRWRSALNEARQSNVSLN